jgi:hypothetical protein
MESLVKTSRLETGAFQFTPINNDINILISMVVNQVLNQATDKNIAIRIVTNENNYSLFDMKWTREA